MYDRRGYAGSRSLGAASDLERHVADLLTLLPSEPATVIGHSVGGLITLTAAAHFPDHFRSIGAFEPPTGWKAWWPDELCVLPGESPEATVERFFRTMVGDHAWERLADSLRAELLSEGPALQSDLQAARSAQPFEPFDIAAPVLLGHGGATNEHYKQAAVELADELPTAELRVIDGAFHGAHRSHPDHFADFVGEVIARGDSPPSTG